MTKYIHPNKVYSHPQIANLAVGKRYDGYYTFNVWRNTNFKCGRRPVEYYPKQKITEEQFKEFEEKLQKYAELKNQQHQEACKKFFQANLKKLTNALTRCKNSTNPFDNCWLGSHLSGLLLKEFLRQTNQSYRNEPATEYAEHLPTELTQLYNQ